MAHATREHTAFGVCQSYAKYEKHTSGNASRVLFWYVSKSGLKEERMLKHILAAILALILVFSFASCKKGPMTEAERVAFYVDYVEFDYKEYEKEK